MNKFKSTSSIPQSWGRFVLGDTPKTPGRKNPALLFGQHELFSGCLKTPRYVIYEHSEESFLKLILGDSSS